MPQERHVYSISAALPVIIVIAISAIAAIAIAAWLVREVASRAIDKTTPESVASVVHELGTLLNPLRLFLPWSSPRCPIEPPENPSGVAQTSLHNETSPNSCQGGQT